MSDKRYENLVSRLSSYNPAPVSPDQLTESIMKNLENGRRRYINLNASRKQWLLINGFRMFITVAAAFLIVFFIIEQREITFKLNRLESQVTTTRVPDNRNAVYMKTKYQKALQIIENSGISVSQDTLANELLMINRKSFNFILYRIQTLEEENKGLREQLRDYGQHYLPSQN